MEPDPNLRVMPEGWRRGQRRAGRCDALLAELASFPTLSLTSGGAPPAPRWSGLLSPLTLPLALTALMVTFTTSAVIILQLLAIILLPNTAQPGAWAGPLWLLSLGAMGLVFGVVAWEGQGRGRRLLGRLRGAGRARAADGESLYRALERLAPLVGADGQVQVWVDGWGWALAAPLRGGGSLALRYVRGRHACWSARVEAPPGQREPASMRDASGVWVRRLGGRWRWRMDPRPARGDWPRELVNLLMGAEVCAGPWTTPGQHRALPLSLSQLGEPAPEPPTDTDAIELDNARKLAAAKPAARGRLGAWGRLLAHHGAGLLGLLGLRQAAVTLDAMGLLAPMAPAVGFAAGVGLLVFVADHPRAPLLRARRPAPPMPLPQRRLALDGELLGLGPGRQIDLSVSFVVELTRGWDRSRRGWMLGIELRQPDRRGGVSRLRLNVPVTSDEALEALPRLDAAAPTVSPEDFRAWLWPLIRHRAELHGVAEPLRALAPVACQRLP